MKITVEVETYDIYKNIYSIEVDAAMVEALTREQLIEHVKHKGNKVDTQFHTECDLPDMLTVCLGGDDQAELAALIVDDEEE
jgi:hypothetical protein